MHLYILLLLIKLFITIALVNSFNNIASPLHSKARNTVYAYPSAIPFSIGRSSSNLYSSGDDTSNASTPTLKQGLLFSSFTDGVLNSPQAKQTLQQMLLHTIYENIKQNKEMQLRESNEFSPCNGPNISHLNDLEYIDKCYYDANISIKDKLEMFVEKNEGLEVRVVYIPTAMYALNPNSDNTPGKQRQRARADGKKRRTILLQTLESLLYNTINVIGVTLDLDDGSIKQPTSTYETSNIPNNGEDAILNWRPNLIYIEGGNTFWLHHCMQRDNWQSLLKQALCDSSSNTIYCGKSAGAIVAGTYVQTACWKKWDDPTIIPNMTKYDDWIKIKGLNFIKNTLFFPHMSPEWDTLVHEKRRELDGTNLDLITLGEEEVFCIIYRGMVYDTKDRNDDSGSNPLYVKIN